MQTSSSHSTEKILDENGIAKRDGEIVRFGVKEWLNNHVITHLIVARQFGQQDSHVVTASSDNRFRIWDVRAGALVTFLVMPRVNCRIDAVCYCEKTFLLVAITYLVDEADVPEENYMIGGPSFCTKHEPPTFRKPNSSCKCVSCKPEESSFDSEVLFWDWTQDEAVPLVPLPEESITIRHQRMGLRRKGTPEYNTVL